MTRQIAEIATHNKKFIQFHITSLKPIRPKNEATEWEKKWLASFEHGEKEKGAFVTEDSQSIFRYMAPFFVEQNCLKCHAQQGYKEGDIRGGNQCNTPTFFRENKLYLIGRS